MEVTDFHYIKGDIDIQEIYTLPDIFINGNKQDYNVIVRDGKKVIEMRNEGNHLLIII